MAPDVKPTRSEELRLKNRIELAESGHSVLEKKRDNLIHELMELIPELKEAQEKLAEVYSDARDDVNMAKAFDGVDRVYSISETFDEKKVDIDQKNIMGVPVPEVSFSETESPENPLEFTSRMASARESFENLLGRIEKIAELETAILNLVEEIESTKRRVNALEHKVIPEMEEALNYVSQKLEEDERESTFRIKKFKEKE